MLPGSPAFAGGLMEGRPVLSSVTRRRRSVAPRATNPSGFDCLKAIANGLVLNSLTPTGSKLTPAFMFSVVNAATPFVMSTPDRQLWTFTLKRNGPFGEEHVPGTYAMLPQMRTLSSRLGNAPETLSKVCVSGSRFNVLPSDLKAAPTSASGFRATVPITSYE